jgi:hypothetical protein
MRTIQIRAAEPTHPEGVTPRATLVIDQAPPSAERLDPVAMQADAELVADVLLATLPGGTLDRVVAQLLRHRASQLTVTLPRPRFGLPEAG